MTVLLTGGRGTVATAVARGLVDAGVPVHPGGRGTGRTHRPDGVGTVHIDLARPETMPAALAGVDRVFPCAEPRGRRRLRPCRIGGGGAAGRGARLLHALDWAQGPNVGSG